MKETPEVIALTKKLSKKTIRRLTWLKTQLSKYPELYAQEDWCGTTFDQKRTLFLDWPERFGNKYTKARTAEERVKVAHEVIDEFIATNGNLV